MKKKERNIMFRISEEDYQTLTKKAKAEMVLIV